MTLDTGALIALERRDPRMGKLMATAHQRRLTLTVPTVALAQWWRGQRGPIWAHVLGAADIEALDPFLAKLAGEALARSGTHDIVDAIVVASAAQRGDVVITGDVSDLQRIAQAAFPGVRVLGL